VDNSSKRRKDEPSAGPSRVDVRTSKEVEEYNVRVIVGGPRDLGPPCWR